MRVKLVTCCSQVWCRNHYHQKFEHWACRRVMISVTGKQKLKVVYYMQSNESLHFTNVQCWKQFVVYISDWLFDCYCLQRTCWVRMLYCNGSVMAKEKASLLSNSSHSSSGWNRLKRVGNLLNVCWCHFSVLEFFFIIFHFGGHMAISCMWLWTWKSIVIKVIIN